MYSAGSRIAQWHLRQHVPPGQGSRRGTRVLWIGGKTCSSSRTPGLPRDKGALTWVRDGNFPCLVGIPRVVSGWSRILSITGGWMADNYFPLGQDLEGQTYDAALNGTRGAQRLSRLKVVPGKPCATLGSTGRRGALAPSNARPWQDAVSPKGGKCAVDSPGQTGTGYP